MSVINILEYFKPIDSVNLDSYVHIYFELNNPFHLCLHLNDFLESIRYVKTVVYSIGRNPEIIWGLYDKESTKFIWNDSCNYKKLNILSNLLKQLRIHNFTLVSNAVKDRISSTMNEFLGKQTLDFEKYRILKYVLYYLDSKITFQNLQNSVDLSKLPEILDFLKIPVESDYLWNEYGYEVPNIKNDYSYLKQYYNIINDSITNYENTLNRVDIDRDSNIDNYISDSELLIIVNAFLQSVQTKEYNLDYTPAECVLELECNNNNPSCGLYSFIKLKYFN
jgi:hypothetical protein